MNKVFKRVGNTKPGYSVFNLSYDKKLTCDMGQLIPIMCDEVVPGDIFEMGAEVVVRFQPLVAPVLHEINCTIHTYFVPYRLLWDDWEDFITGGVLGDDASVLPTWEPTDTTVGSLWDYLGFPTGVDPDGAYPIDFPRRAYNMIYNEYYRDETLISEELLTNESILIRAWEKDYFTSALLWQQRGTAPALPISGTSSATWTAADVAGDGVGTAVTAQNAIANAQIHTTNAQSATNILNALNSNTVDFSTATTFDVSDLRLAFQMQRWLERNARAGARYVEFLGAHFGVHPRDDRLQRPEYIGGLKMPCIISEVLQTSSTDATTPQGNLAGHGLSAQRNFIGKYRANEFGLIMSIMSIMPKPVYQQGINRQWLKSTKYDFYFPEFANLSEQAIIRAEIYADGVSANNNTIFGYQGRYDELRTKQSMVVGEMRTTFDYWHLARQFGAAPALNQTFIECVTDNRIFAVPADPGLIVNVANVIKAIRPIPIMANPGYIDH